jgi:hypothetical protein
VESTVQGTSRVEPAWGRPQIVGAAARISETMRTFARLFGTGFAVLLLVLAATAQAGGGKAVTPPSAGLGLDRKLSNRLLIELDMGLQPTFHTIYCGGDRYRTHSRAVFGGGAVSR